MAYVTQNFYSGQKLTDEHMKHIEAGISTADANATKALDIAQKDHATLPPEIAGKADNWMIEEETGLAYLTSGGKKISSGIMIPNDGSGVGGSGSAGTPYAVQYVFQKLTDEQKEQARENIGAGNAGQINLKKYGITEGNIDHKAPYSAAEWEQAYNNFEGIKAALADMAANGQTSIMLPKGTYVVCYQNPNGKEFWDNFGWEIVIPSHVTFDLNGSTIRVIFDSNNRNPYDKSTLEPYKLNGTVFAFSQSYHSSICNGTLLGDRYERAYTNGSEKNQEQTYGIKFTKGAEHCAALNMDISGFMGDAITGAQHHDEYDPDKGGIVTEVGKAKHAYTSLFLDNTGAETTGSGYSFVSDYHDLSAITSVGGKVMMLFPQITSFSGYNFAHSVKIFFYDTDKVFLSADGYDALSNIPIPHNARYCRIMTDCAKAYNDGISSFELMYTISPPTAQFVTISNCKIYNNNRGGMSNLPHDTTIEKCELYENGTTGTEGWPEFGDTTRYAINCEDRVCRKIVIKDNYFHDGGVHCMLLSANYALVEGNRIINFGIGVGGYCLQAMVAKNIVFSGNWVENAATPSFSNGLTSLDGRSLTVVNNSFKNCTLRGSDNVIFRDNVIVDDFVDIKFTNTKPITWFDITEEIGGDNTFLAGDIKGTFVDSTFNLRRKSNSSSYNTLDFGEKSKGNIIECTGDAKNRKLVLTNLFGTTVIGGQYKHDPGTYHVENSTLKPASSWNYDVYGGEATYNAVFKDASVIVNDDFGGLFVIQIGGTNGATKIEVNLEFNNCTIDMYKAISHGIVYMRQLDVVPDVLVNLTFKNCTFNNHTTGTIKVTNLYGSTMNSSNYKLVWEGNTLNGNWTEPTQP